MRKEEYLIDLIQDISRQRGITKDNKLQEDLGLDSLDMQEICIQFEIEFQLDDTPEEEIEKWKTVQDIIDYVNQNA